MLYPHLRAGMLSACLLLLFSSTLTSCFIQTSAARGGPKPAHSDYSQVGFIHTVQKGETLWSIATKYNVRVEAIRQMNQTRVPDIYDIKIGTRLLIPGEPPKTQAATGVLAMEIPMNVPARSWQYIVVHHSATAMGCASEFDRHHKERGWSGVGYDFVINNGTCGHPDGEIEVTPRWLYQKTGAHCKAGGMNSKGIGICLVGNFSKTKPSARQLNSLLRLITHLQRQFNIPAERVTGHGQVHGAKTECPGKFFPWSSIRPKLLR